MDSDGGRDGLLMGTRKFGEQMEMFAIFFVAMVSCMYMEVRTHQMVH